VQDAPLEEYLPTFVVDDEVLVLEGIPADVDHREALQRHALGQGWDKRVFLFGVLSSKSTITTGRYDPHGSTFMTLERTATGCVTSPAETPNWWWLGSNNRWRGP